MLEVYQIVVCGYFNSSYEELSDWMIDSSLQDMIHSKHGKWPITYERSAYDPIGYIFGSPSLQIIKGRFLSFGRLHSDHRRIWMDVPDELILGFNPSPLMYPKQGD